MNNTDLEVRRAGFSFRLDQEFGVAEKASLTSCTFRASSVSVLYLIMADRDIDNYPTLHRTALHSNELSSLKCQSCQGGETLREE